MTDEDGGVEALTGFYEYILIAEPVQPTTETYSSSCLAKTNM